MYGKYDELSKMKIAIFLVEEIFVLKGSQPSENHERHFCHAFLLLPGIFFKPLNFEAIWIVMIEGSVEVLVYLRPAIQPPS